MRIIVIEDDRLIGDALQSGLQSHSFQVDWFTTGKHGSAAVAAADYEAAIVDLGLPDVDGLDLLQEWRQAGLVLPVLILTARDAIPERVKGLNAGADDYMCKPFALEEVIARLNALVRRDHGQAHNQLTFGQLTLDLSDRLVYLRGEQLPVNHREFALLSLLLTHRTQIFSRVDLSEKLYSWDQDIESNAIEVHIHNLRKKIGKSFIKTWRNLGYQLGEAP